MPLSLLADGETLVTDWEPQIEPQDRCCVFSAVCVKAVRIVPPIVKPTSIAHSIDRTARTRNFRCWLVGIYCRLVWMIQILRGRRPQAVQFCIFAAICDDASWRAYHAFRLGCIEASIGPVH